jgi:uncharacterized membrane protein YoaK (UPF0700 family)
VKPAQASLKFLFLVVLGVALVFRSAVFVGWASLTWISGVSLLLVLLCIAWAFAPRATNHALAVLAIGAMSFSILVCSITQSRELARRQQCSNNLRQLGLEMQECQGFARSPLQPRGQAASDPFARVWASFPSPGEFRLPAD